MVGEGQEFHNYQFDLLKLMNCSISGPLRAVGDFDVDF